jgi:hypothetical protein
MMNRQDELQQIDKALAEMRRARAWARILLALARPLERLGGLAAHNFADHQRDVMDECNYGIEDSLIHRSRLTGEDKLIGNLFPEYDASAKEAAAETPTSATA